MRFVTAAAVLLLAASAAAAQQAQPEGALDLDRALEGPPEAPPEAVVGEPLPAQRLSAVGVDALEGGRVVSPTGEKLGEIEKLVIDPGYGRITYAIVEVGGFLGVADREVAVPWAALRLGSEDNLYILDSTRERLANAPAIDDDRIARVTDLDVARSVHAYYGLRPYWSDSNAPQQAEAAGR